ncbi:tetratricopeptide repeat protein [Tenacibaculum sp. IB213877]|uniref:tetratricopeptide repeat protein n=1 Tax=Tenacibaculum sp. IB213877 TaxID=3097351 RepID=UPI002A5A3CA8|nr:tetratricopeptide repeat protein [Tenacibaculum sp. IB213877]MDY0780502.1 hypothetical protein [Tenacibaculum sp. IB213877]
MFLLLILTFSLLNAQDSIVLKSGIEEKKKLDFQEFFFKAITEKAINNPQRAIENLEECNALIPNNKAVLFELSKNYYQLNRIPEAVQFAKQALALEPDNLWIQEHLVSAYKREMDFGNAISLQNKIAAKYPKKKEQLVFLHIQNGDSNTAKLVLNELAEAKLLTPRLRNLQKRLLQKEEKTSKIIENKPVVNGSLQDQFKKDRSYKTLTELLNKLDEDNNPQLLTYSEQGIALFPAQPFVYLMNGKALNKKNEFKKAVESLQNGIDFVIDDDVMQNRFYSELVKAYKALRDSKNAIKYQKKLK